MTDLLSPSQFPTRLRGRNPQTIKFPLKWAHDYLLSAPIEGQLWPNPSFPIDITGGITDFGMMGNDVWGDCFACGKVHIEMTTAVAADVQGPSPDSNEAVEECMAYTGAAQPPGPGADLASYLLWLVKQGKIKAFAPVDQTDKPMMQYIMSQGFGLYTGVNLVSTNEGQFNAGQPMDCAPGEQPDPDDGHCVVLSVSQSPTGPHAVITWGVSYAVTDAWLEACLINNPNGEAYLVVTTEEQMAKFDPQLLSDVAALGGTGGEAASSPAPEPAPAPEEPPAPAIRPFPQPPAPLPIFYAEWEQDVARWKAEAEARIIAFLAGQE